MNDNDPFDRFATVFRAAQALGIPDPNAMCLATADANGAPSTRMVLLKEWSRDGFVFYTNLQSGKGREILANPHVSLTFHWRELEQQVHIRGAAARVSDEEADAYFATRPHTSKLGAWASQQSRPLANRAILLTEVARLEALYIGRTIPRPPHWSGFRVTPTTIEFWTAGAFRLHDRQLFERDGDEWRVSRLFP